MLRFAKRICWLTILGLGVQSALPFALLGPRGQSTGQPDGYQQIVINYQLPGDIGTPKNLGEEYRRNTPVMYYTFDANFLDYFGSEGSNAVAQAFELMNTLTNVSSYSGNLTEFPLAAQEFNYQAQALQLQDIKSTTLNLLVEQLGLAEPDRYTWTLRDRVAGSACPITTVYVVIQRNFDPVWSTPSQFQTSSYVNGTLYTYYIFDICTPPPANIADAVEFPVDPLANVFTAIASGFSDFGGFYTSLTRDDVGGLRYLLRTNNMNIESAGPDTVTFITNNNLQLLFTSNLTLFSAQALTNDAATLAALYPGLIITDTQNIFTNVVTTNVFAYFTNLPWSPAGSPATLVTFTTYTTNVATWFQHTFANVRILTNLPSFSTTGTITLLTTTVGSCGPNAPAGLICTNNTVQNFSIPMISGNFFILPSNACDISIISTQFVSVIPVTNLVVVATNAGAANVNGQQFSVIAVTYFTNYIFTARTVICPSDTVALRQGIEKITFVKRDFDSEFHRFFYPVTNDYILNAITNNTLFPQRMRRVVLAPDFLITAADIGDNDPNNTVLPGAGVARNITFNASNVQNSYPGLAGPGTIARQGTAGAGTTFTYSKMGPYFDNQFTTFFFGSTFITTSEANQTQFFVWGSFDGTTNLPVVYPNGTSITNLENSILIQTSPSDPQTNGVVYLPNGTVGVNYATAFGGFSATGGQPPYTWEMAPGSPALPPNLTLNPNGTISGVPAASTAGLTFDFTVRMTDNGSRFVDRSYAIKINP